VSRDERYLHVVCQYGSGTSGFCHRSTQSEVTDFDVAVSVEEQIRGFDVSMEEVYGEGGRGGREVVEGGRKRWRETGGRWRA
jgi:hypothetical protein